jgi:hypothetical protein
MRIFTAFVAVWLCLGAVLAQQPSNRPAPEVSAKVQALADSFQKKFDYLQLNGTKAHPDPKPTIITEDELNAYFDAGRVKLPAGVDHVHFVSTPGILNSNLLVNFDELRAGRAASNPLLGLFTGTHQVDIVANGEASAGTAHAHVQSVSLDDVQVPRFLLELFVTKVLQPKYPKAALDSDFKLPGRMDTVTLGNHQFTITQK